MKKLCPVCNTLNDSIGFDLSEQEIHNLHKIGLSEHLCKTCYNKELSAMLEAKKAELIPLNKEREITQTAYYKAYESWKKEAELYKAIDYNLNLIKHIAKQKELLARRPTKSDDPADIETICKKILAKLTQEQQEAILQAYQMSKQ